MPNSKGGAHIDRRPAIGRLARPGRGGASFGTASPLSATPAETGIVRSKRSPGGQLRAGVRHGDLVAARAAQEEEVQ